MRFLRNKTGNQYPVAIFHLSVKPISRSAGRSATAAAAYRAGEKIIDERTGEIHDYTRKGGVESADIVLPDGAPEWATDRAKLWNAAELAEKRKDACVAREFEVALPSELSPAERRRLALDFAKDMANREGCAVDVAIHAPGKEGDNRNWHAHILRTTRKVDADGLGAKLDTEQAGRKRKDDLEQVRECWASMTNSALETAGHTARVSHLSLEAQGIDRDAGIHLGPAATAIERRGEVSEKTQHHQERQQEAAGKVAAMVAIAQAQAKAADQARAEAEAAAAAAARAKEAQAQQAADRAKAQAEQLAIDAKLTAEKEEKENDRIRAAAFESIGNNVKAAGKDSERCGRLDGFIKSDHADIEKADGAIGRDAEAGARVLLAAREHLRTGIRLADSNGANLGRAIEGTRRRVARSHLESCAAAFAKQLGRVDKVLQQAGRLFTGVVSTLATAAKEVIQRGIELNLDRIHKVEEAEFQKALQAEQAAKTIPTVQVSRFDKTGLWRSDDLDLVNRAKELFAQPKPDGYARYMLSQDLSKAMSAAVREIRDTEPRHASADAERTIKAEQNADARRAGQQEPWKAEQTACAWDTIAFRLDRERKQHLETKRPTGMFSGAAAKEYDTKTAGLTSQINNITRATAVLKAQLVEKVAEQARQQAQKGPQHAAAQERHAGLSLLHKAVAEATRQIDAQQEKTHDRGMGGMDYGR